MSGETERWITGEELDKQKAECVSEGVASAIRGTTPQLERTKTV